MFGDKRRANRVDRKKTRQARLIKLPQRLFRSGVGVMQQTGGNENDGERALVRRPDAAASTLAPLVMSIESPTAVECAAD